MSPSSAEKGRWDRYWDDSRDLGVSALLIVPLLLAYEIGLVLLHTNDQNAIDYVLKAPLVRLLGPNAFLVFNGLVVVAAGCQFARSRASGRLRPEVWAGVCIEGALYAFFLGRVVTGLLGPLDLSLPTLPEGSLAIVLSLGAGVYEELFFRFALLITLTEAGRRWLGLERSGAGVFAILLGSLLFSAAHHLPGVDPGVGLGIEAFLFRFGAGVLLCSIFLTRGLAVAVYTHAIYDCIVLL